MKIKCEGEALDIQTIYDLSDADYRTQIADGGDAGFFVDQHDVLRDAAAGRPIATTLEQFDILIEELSKQRNRMSPRK